MLSYCLLTSIISDKKLLYSYYRSPVCDVLSFSNRIQIFFSIFGFQQFDFKMPKCTFFCIYLLAELVGFSTSFEIFWTFFLKIFFSALLSPLKLQLYV